MTPGILDTAVLDNSSKIGRECVKFFLLPRMSYEVS